MADKHSKLRTFLANRPQPAKVRLRKGDEEQDVALAEAVRHRWRMAEEACLAWGADVVECLDAKGALLRSYTIERDDDDDKNDKRAATAKGAEYKGLAEVIDRIAERHNEAFDRGAEATGRSQDQLVSLVELLTVHLTHAITSMYNVSASYASLLQGKEPEEGNASSQAAMMNLVGAAIGKLAQPPAAPKPQNGKG
jgi:uncharacterized membrane protein YqiK